MALRPAGKTLSSLTGILVMAAVLWLLLNFVYAPSCGRFACGLEPAWWPQAEADSGVACPDSISAAAEDAEWAAARIASLREADAKVTTGLFYDSDGTEHTIRSGRDADAKRADKALVEAGVEMPRAGPHPAASHVETKIAALMRENGITYGIVVINNDRGPCGTDPDALEPFSCGVVIPAILPTGSTLAIWSPKDPDRPVMLSGRAQ
ncbi:DddA-like double-stranded DNA deaminase toxin [Actinokineospora iranica]|uniref:DddA-like double-stranded DNA deaminase toxin n=1 Tax=Actinokineospora iranica TaxID=1271860 RepID=UPI00111383E8|nr:DddA-like double-stranded DNA deaminase toxin [Actinokineospora iranica]